MGVDGSRAPEPRATWAPSQAATKPSPSTGHHVSYFHIRSEKGHSLQRGRWKLLLTRSVCTPKASDIMTERAPLRGAAPKEPMQKHQERKTLNQSNKREEPLAFTYVTGPRTQGRKPQLSNTLAAVLESGPLQIKAKGRSSVSIKDCPSIRSFIRSFIHSPPTHPAIHPSTLALIHQALPGNQADSS